MIKLKGMTWDHSRGYDPMIATSIRFAEKHDNEVDIEWDKRPLQAFADRPIEEMTDDYDLIVIDYPHVGEVAAKGLLQNLDTPKYNNEIELLKNHQHIFISENRCKGAHNFFLRDIPLKLTPPPQKG